MGVPKDNLGRFNMLLIVMHDVGVRYHCWIIDHRLVTTEYYHAGLVALIS